jgi:uncharacterized protein (TIGR02147 family)
MLGYKRYREAHRLDASHAEYHACWYVPAIRELVGCDAFQEDARWIANAMLPPIKPSEAASALTLLLKLGLLERDAAGKLRQTSAIVSTGAEVRGVHIVRYHTEMIARAAQSLDRVPAAERDISALTLTVSERGLARLKQRIQEMRRELLSMAESEAERTRVVQLNVQLFPLSRSTERVSRTPKKAPRGEEPHDA